MIELKSVTLGYDGIDPIQNLSAALPEKGVVAVVGASGIGKSTLLKGIAGIIKSKSGEIICDKKLSMVFQENRLIHSLSALDNVLLVGKDEKRAHKMLETVGLQAMRKAGVRAGGMQRRKHCTRFNVHGDAILLDEPSSLDKDAQ